MLMIPIQRWQLICRCRLGDDLSGIDEHTALLNDNNLGAARRENFVGLADVRSSAYLCGYNIDLQLLSGGFYFSRLRASFWVSHIIEQSDGIVSVAFFSATALILAAAAITSGLSWTNSAASGSMRSA